MNKRTNSFLSGIINFFKRVFNIKNKNLLPESNIVTAQNIENNQTFKQNIEVKNNTSEKNITLFLYKQLRLGNLKPQYIPDQYLEKIDILLKEEKKIKQNNLNKINKQILQTEQDIKKYSKKQ